MDKYAPTRLEDFTGNKDTVQYVNALIETNELNMLIVGETCSGKTTFIQAVLSAANITDINSVLYVNSLKDQGINYYRHELKIFCQSQTANKVVVIDDFDTISEQVSLLPKG